MQGELSPKKTGTNKVRPCLHFNYVSDIRSYLAVIIALEHLFSMSLVSVALPCDKANDRYKNKSEKHCKCACVDRRGKVYAPKCSCVSCKGVVCHVYHCYAYSCDKACHASRLCYALPEKSVHERRKECSCKCAP